MIHERHLSVIIPAYNEAASIGKVLQAIPKVVDEIIVVDNGSTDQTAKVATDCGAKVVPEAKRGYGAACLSGIEQLTYHDIVIFLDGDFSDYPQELEQLIQPIIAGTHDLVIGSRNLGGAEPGSLTAQARFGNWLACWLIAWFWKVKFTDLGPFRAITYAALQRLSMQDQNYGWTVEMQIKAVMMKLQVTELPVRYRARIGQSKISGTIAGVIGAGVKILSTIFFAKAGLFPNWPGRAQDHLIIMSRYPKPGKTKTRLIPALGLLGAANQQIMMTEHLLRVVRQLQRTRQVSVEIRTMGGRKSTWQLWLGKQLTYRSQGGGDLGQKMARAFRQAFQAGKRRLIIIGTDCAQITKPILEQAFRQLEITEATIGPAHDGGYYLIGLNRYLPMLFDNINWGSDEVWNQTQALLQQHHIAYQTLPRRADIDRPEDLTIWQQASAQQTQCGPKLSIIIPVKNEAATIGSTLQSVIKMNPFEIIVVDGGSQDNTRAVVNAFDTTLITSRPGRGRQMNEGARQARGDILLFLHGDTVMPEGGEISIQEILGRPGTMMGAFRLAIQNSNFGEKNICFWANWRSVWLKLPYGDQAFFLYRHQFYAMGGFREIPIMEDYDFVKRVKQRGRIALAKQAVLTAGRRWRRLGIVKTTMINQLIVLGYHLGIPLERLATWYRLGK